MDTTESIIKPKIIDSPTSNEYKKRLVKSLENQTRMNTLNKEYINNYNSYID